MQRILVVGPCGAGKSTLSRELGRRLGLPVFHLDRMHWNAGWVEGSKEDLLAELAPVLASDRWIIDGNYGSTMAARLPHADTIVYLDFPISLCLWRLARRVVTHRGTTRPDMADDCPERFDPAFFWYVARWNQGPGPRTEQLLRSFEGHLIRLTSQARLDAWLASIEKRRP